MNSLKKIKELNELRKKGILTDEEFETEKKKTLSLNDGDYTKIESKSEIHESRTEATSNDVDEKPIKDNAKNDSEINLNHSTHNPQESNQSIDSFEENNSDTQINYFPTIIILTLFFILTIMFSMSNRSVKESTGEVAVTTGTYVENTTNGNTQEQVAPNNSNDNSVSPGNGKKYDENLIGYYKNCVNGDIQSCKTCKEEFSKLDSKDENAKFCQNKLCEVGDTINCINDNHSNTEEAPKEEVARGQNDFKVLDASSASRPSWIDSPYSYAKENSSQSTSKFFLQEAVSTKNQSVACESAKNSSSSAMQNLMQNSENSNITIVQTYWEKRLYKSMQNSNVDSVIFNCYLLVKLDN